MGSTDQINEHAAANHLGYPSRTREIHGSDSGRYERDFIFAIQSHSA